MEVKQGIRSSDLSPGLWVLERLSKIGCFLLAMGISLIAACGTTQTNQAAIMPEPLYSKMTDQDVAHADHTVQKALEAAMSNTTIRWRNPATGNAGSVTPQRTYQAKGGFYCRVYAETLTIINRTESYVNTACRDADRLWKPI